MLFARQSRKRFNSLMVSQLLFTVFKSGIVQYTSDLLAL